MGASPFQRFSARPQHGFLSRGRGRALWRKVLAPVTVLVGIAVVELLVAYFPNLPEPAPIILVGVAFSGFVAGLESGVLSSLIAMAYAFFLVTDRHGGHGTTIPLCVHAAFLGGASPLLGIMSGRLRNTINRTAETLQSHLRNTPLGVIELYDDFEVRLWAGSAEMIFGFTSKEAVGKNIFDLPGVFFGDDDSDEARRVLEELGSGEISRAVHHSRTDSSKGDPGHSRWFWSTTLESYWGESRYLVLVEDITERVKAQELLEASKTELIERLVRAVEYRDNKTGFHVARISLYCEALGRAAGLDKEECDLLRKASPMHDIGKIGIPDSILLTSEKLTDEEFDVIKKHPFIGANILTGSDHTLIEMAEKIALTHHEKWDGTGYPRGLKGEEIPFVGRICAVCDVFDALTSERPYKRAWSVSEAIHELDLLAGAHLDAKLVEQFKGILPEIEAIYGENADAA